MLYGHIHGSGAHRAFRSSDDGISYRLVAADSNDFTPVLVKKAKKSPVHKNLIVFSEEIKNTMEILSRCVILS